MLRSDCKRLDACKGVRGGRSRRWLLTLGILFCTSAAIHAPAQAGGLFVAPPQYPAAIWPAALAIGDFNGDGNLDLAVLGPCITGPSWCANILLGKTNGSFQSALVGVETGYLTAAAVGDFNGDGKLDLAVTMRDTNVVSVFLGNGDGTFQTGVEYATAAQPSQVAVGDFNGDGIPDLVVASANGMVSIFLNGGNGTFPKRNDYSTGGQPVSLAVGDFNKDGKLDVAAAVCLPSCSGAGVVAILLGNGNGTLQSHVDYTLAGAPPYGCCSIAAADLDGDGALDLSVVNAGRASVLLGNGDGTFQTHQDYTAGAAPSSVVAGDFNGDGQLDLAVMLDGTVSLLVNQGHGTFSEAGVYYHAGGRIWRAAAGDFNHDSKLDLAVLVIEGAVSVLLGNGDGSFRHTSLAYSTDPAPLSVAVADFNGDTKNDIAVANYGNNTISVFPGNGDGTFQPRVNYTTGGGPSSVATGDFNRDGKPDLVTANRDANSVSVLLNNGNGSFATHVDYPTAPGPSFVAIGDVNGDGEADIAVACNSGSVSILFGAGDGTFQARRDYAMPGSGGAHQLALGDFNGDGRLDLAVTDDTSIAVLLNNGDGSFGAPVTISSSMFGPYGRIVVADFNGDGKLDFDVEGYACRGWSHGCAANSVSGIFLGNGDGTFQSPQIYSGPWGVGVAADFNHDGNVDVAMAGVQLFLGNGDGTFHREEYYTGGFGPASMATGDFNGDGRPDLAVTDGTSATLDILLNTGQVATSFKLSVSPASQAVTQGGSASFLVTATTNNGFNSAISLECYGDYGAPCTVDPPSLIPTASGTPATATVDTRAYISTGTYTVVIAGTSGVEQFTVKAALTMSPTAPDFTVSAVSAPTPSAVAPGQSATAKVTVSSSGNFYGPIVFACSVSPTPVFAPTCSLDPAEVSLTGGGQVTSTLTIRTTGPTTVRMRPNVRSTPPVFYALFFPIFGLVLLRIGLRPDNKTKRKLLGFVIWCVLFGGLVFQVACSSGGSTGFGSPGTPSGSYTVNVTASSGPTQHATSLTLTVQ